MQDVLQFLNSAFSRLGEGDAIVGISDRHVESLNLVAHALRNGDASGVIDSAVDAFA